MQVDQTSERRTLRRRKEKVPKHQKRGVNEKEMEMDSFTKRVLMIPLDKPFEETYFTHRLWMFFIETKETELNIHMIFNQIREKMKQRITLKKKSDPVPCLVKGIEFPCVLCDTCSSVSILPKVMANHLGLMIVPSEDSFTFVDHSTRNSRGIIRDLEVQIDNALVPVDFHVLETKQNKNHSLLLGRAFMATVGAVCNMQTNHLCLTLINPDVYNDPVRIVNPQTSNTRVNTVFIAACQCNFEDEYETEYSGSIDSRTLPSIDIVIRPSIDNQSRESTDNSHVNKIFALPERCYPSFAVSTHPQTSIDYHHSDTISRQGDYCIGS